MSSVAAPAANTTNQAETVNLAVTSKVKDYIKSKGDYQVSADFIAALNKQITVLCDASIARCVGNGRKTLRSTDL